MTTNQTPATAKVSARLLALMEQGKTLPEAWDALLPSYPFEVFAGELYDALRARQGAR